MGKRGLLPPTKLISSVSFPSVGRSREDLACLIVSPFQAKYVEVGLFLGADINGRQMREKLEIVIGTWITTGNVIDDDGQKSDAITAIDAYEWDAGRTHIIHHAASQIGDLRFGGTEILTIDAAGLVTSHLFNLPDPYRSARVTIADDCWTWHGDEMMCVAYFSADGLTQTAHHRRRRDGEWVPSMEVVLRKVPAAHASS